MPNSKRTEVRAEYPSGACGKLAHMTVDELRARSVGNGFDGTCPVCGKFHFTRAEIEKIDCEKIVDTEGYKTMKNRAMVAG